MKDGNKNQRGFTIIEVVLVVFFFSVIFSLITVNVFRAQRTTSLTSVVSLLNADIKQQQLQAMVGNTGSDGSQAYYGIHFETDRYVLFQGASYDPGNSSNFVVELSDDLAFESFAGSSIVFSPLSGEILSYPPGGINIVLGNLNGNEEEGIELNRLGTISEI